MSVPPDSSGSKSPDPSRETLLSPTSAAHPLPPRPSSNLSASAIASTEQSQTATPVQAQPRTRGGFEVDDDDEDDNEQDGDEDDVDVYDPAAGLDFDASTPGADHVPVDSTQSPVQMNGITPAPAPATGSPVGVTSSTPLPDSGNRLAVAETPAQAVVDIQAQPSPLPSSVNGPSSTAVSRSRLAHDTIGILEDRIKEDPRGDPEAYLALIEEYKRRNNQEQVRATFDRFLTVFPRNAQQWSAYLRWEDSHDQKARMEALFNKSLRNVLNVDLWMIYINYVRRNFSGHRDEALAYKTINDVFKFALQTIGIDKNAGKVWQEHINFLKSGPGTLGGGSWQDGAKADQVREAYQKAIAVPTEAVTQLWREYDLFENNLSKINGRKHVQEMSPAYMTARTAYHQLGNITTGLDGSTQPRLPPRPGCQGDDDWSRQLDLWYAWIDFEKEDPLVLKDDDRAAYQDRILYVYKQALMALQFWPGMWYSAAEFCFENGLDKEGMSFLEDGFAAIPESPLLALRLADRIEATTQNDETSDPGAKDRMKKVRQPYDAVLEALYNLHKTAAQREKDQIQQREADSEAANGDGPDDEVNAANVASKKAALDAQIAAVKAESGDELELLVRLISHVWIAIARATRRIQGKGDASNGFRGVFNEARKRGRLTSHFYVECAAIEWQCYKDAIGTKILERGMKLFPDDEYLPMQYIRHLFDTHDVTNARGVFETTVTKLTGAGHVDRTRSLFRFMHTYESRFGELSQIQKLEHRMRELFPGLTPMDLFSDRHATEPFDPIEVFPVVSPSQIRPKTGGIIPSIEGADLPRSPVQNVIDAITTNSPKRPLPDDFDDNPARKMARGESPLKGAAGRRMNQQRQTNGSTSISAPLPPPLPPQIHYLLSILPKPQFYTDTRFDAAKMVNLIRDVHLPPPGQIPAQHTPQPPPIWPHQQPQHFAHLPQPPLPGQPFPGMPPTPVHGQYNGAPFRFA